jgi:hypothetical protein
VTFVVPGTGEHSEGSALPLAPIAAPAPPWWSTVLATLPSSRDTVEDRWAGRGYTVRARYDGSGETAALSLTDTSGHQWSLGDLPLPVRRVLWLDAPALDSLHRAALARAFDDAVLYDDDARLAARTARPGAPARVRFARATLRDRTVTQRVASRSSRPANRRLAPIRANRARLSPT